MDRQAILILWFFLMGCLMISDSSHECTFDTKGVRHPMSRTEIPKINMTKKIIWGDTVLHTFNVETNGILSTGTPIEFYTYDPYMPINILKDREHVIMGYFGSISYENTEDKRAKVDQYVSYRLSTDPDELTKASEIVRGYGGGGPADFSATELLIATWNNFQHKEGFLNANGFRIN